MVAIGASLKGRERDENSGNEGKGVTIEDTEIKLRPPSTGDKLDIGCR